MSRVPSGWQACPLARDSAGMSIDPPSRLLNTLFAVEKTLEERLRDWLDEQGYPLEMVVARSLRAVGFRVTQGEYYEDPESTGFRELDISAFLADAVEGGLARITYVVECKRSREKPWILFTSPPVRMSPVASVAQRAASEVGQRFLAKLTRRRDVQNLPAFSIPNRTGYALTQAFTSKADVAYAAAASVSDAALAQAKAADRDIRMVCEVAFPAVVVDGRLFECYLDAGDEMHISEISSGTLFWRNPILGVRHTVIQVVTRVALDDFARDAHRSAEFLLESCRPDWEQAINEGR